MHTFQGLQKKKRTMTTPFLVFGIICNLLLIPIANLAQQTIPAVPQNVRAMYFFSGGFIENVPSTFIQYEIFTGGGYRPRCRPVSFDVLFDSVQGATFYRLDVAEDSLFIRILPGLRNYTVRPPFEDCFRPQFFIPDSRYGTSSCNPRIGEGAIRVVNLLQGKKYYVRLKSVNGAGESFFSTTASIIAPWSVSYQTSYTTTPPYSALRDRYLSAQIRQLTDTSVTFAFVKGENVRVQAVLNYKDTIAATQGDEITVRGLRPGTTNTITMGAIPPKRCCVEDSLSFRIHPFSRGMARYGRVISYYEGPEDPGTGADSLYYWVFFSPGASLEQIEDSLRALQARRIAVDTAWFHTGGFVTCIGENIDVCSQLDISNPILIIKLRKNDSRMPSFGYNSGFIRARQLGDHLIQSRAWRFSDEAVYYRFDIGSTVPVREVPDAKGYSLSIVPNPMQGTSEIRYTLPEASTITTEVYDVLGRTIFTLPEQWQTAGEHSVSFETSGLSAGLYVVRCTVRNAGGIKYLSQQSPLIK